MCVQDPKDSLELLKDLCSCMERAQAKKSKKKKATGMTSAVSTWSLWVNTASLMIVVLFCVTGSVSAEEEPHWVEVVVEILLSLLSQPSRLVRNVCRVVFTRICSEITQGALNSILNVRKHLHIIKHAITADYNGHLQIFD